MRSSIFLNEISVIDHAYINHKGNVIGGSFLCSFIVSGETDETEKVVIDFSTVKKEIKSIIDDHHINNSDNGFDHNLWLLQGYSNYNTYVDPNVFSNINIITPCCSISVPSEYVKIFNSTDYYIPTIANEISKFVLEKLEKKYPNINLSIKCDLSERPVLPPFSDSDNWLKFRYVHGLKDSTSFGCRNIAHGHLSYLLSENTDIDTLLIIKHDLDSCIFINKENIVTDNDEFIEISYTIGENFFFSKYNKNSNNLVILETETTIEFLAEYVKNKYEISTNFYISEGLNKGAYIS